MSLSLSIKYDLLRRKKNLKEIFPIDQAENCHTMTPSTNNAFLKVNLKILKNSIAFETTHI